MNRNAAREVMRETNPGIATMHGGRSKMRSATVSSSRPVFAVNIGVYDVQEIQWRVDLTGSPIWGKHARSLCSR
jgi:hypothetical protein